MLVLSRRCETEIYVGSDIIIKVLEIHKRQVKLGIEAPSGLPVRRVKLPPINNRGEPAVAKDRLRSQQPCIAKLPQRRS